MDGTSLKSCYRRWEPGAKLLGMAAAVALVAGCAHVVPVARDGRAVVPEGEEHELWLDAEREERVIDGRVTRYPDAAVGDYLAVVAAGLLPDAARVSGAPPVRISVIGDPALNAFAMPDGRLYIHTGVLARLENEAQLATVLAHELAHVASRDALRVRWDHWRADNEPEGSGANLFVALGLRLASVASVSGYGSSLERQADDRAMQWMIAAGYDPREAPRAWERLADDRGDPTRIERFALGRHAWLQERIASTRKLLRTRHGHADPAGLRRDRETFARHTQGLLRDNARLEMRAGRFALAREQLDRATTLAPRDPVVPLYRGDLYRLRAQREPAPGERLALLSRAREAYEHAATLAPGAAEPFHGLGLLYFQSRDYVRAREAFERYLALSPDAPDARRFREYIVELSR